MRQGSAPTTQNFAEPQLLTPGQAIYLVNTALKALGSGCMEDGWPGGPSGTRCAQLTALESTCLGHSPLVYSTNFWCGRSRRGTCRRDARGTFVYTHTTIMGTERGQINTPPPPSLYTSLPLCVSPPFCLYRPNPPTYMLISCGHYPNTDNLVSDTQACSYLRVT